MKRKRHGRAPSQQAIDTNGESKIVEKRKKQQKKAKQTNSSPDICVYANDVKMVEKGGTRDHPNIDQKKKKSK